MGDSMLQHKLITGSLVLAAVLTTIIVGSGIQATIKAGDITGGKVAPHINIAAFHTLHGQEGFKFPDHIADSDIMSALHGKAQYLFMNHTAGLEDGDVIMVTNDVLRDNAGSFEDFGVGCQLSVHIKDGQDAQIAGMCEFLMVDKNHRQIQHKGVIKPVTLHPGKDWVLLYNDIEDGIAIYADEEVGIE